MAKDEKNNAFSILCLTGSLILTLLSCYWFCAPRLARYGISAGYLNEVMYLYRDFFSDVYTLKGFSAILIICCAAFRTGKKQEIKWSTIGGYCGAGVLLYFIYPKDPYLYTFTSLTGLMFMIYGFSLIFRRLRGNFKPDEEEGFLQCDDKIETEYSVNIQYHYYYKQQLHNAWINLVGMFRALLILGVPGSGKSFACYSPIIEQTIRKKYTMFLYDYKFPDLTEQVLSEIYYQTKHENLWAGDEKKPAFYVLNFDDPMRSHRCNPIHHTYITDPADTTEIADLLFKNINKGGKQGFDFFNESAKVYLDALTWWLANYDPDALYNKQEDLDWIEANLGVAYLNNIPRNLLGDMDGSTVIGSKTNYQKKGIYCTFPHIIELMAYNYKKVFQILQFTKGLEAKISPFASALEGGAMEQLQGQIASAQIPMGKFVSPALYWVMTGNDFTLDFNDPDNPKIICMGNNPDRQSIYGSAIALYTSRMFKLINHKHKRHSVVLLDEFPTVYIKGIDNLIATARSNKVSICLGCQDMTQLTRDYGQDEAKVIFNTVGSILSGQVNGETAKTLSGMFGKEYRERKSRSLGDDSDSTTISYQLEEILPSSKMEALTPGTFFGKTADLFEAPIERKLFCGAIDIDNNRNKAVKKEWQKVPIITDFFDGQTPEIPEFELERLKKLHPKDADNMKKLQQEYIIELRNVEIMKNFNQIKEDIKDVVESEFKRTKPLAEAYKERMKEEGLLSDQ